MSTDSYADYVHPLTLPQGSTAVTPLANTFTITPEASVVTNFFLVSNTNCLSTQPPPQGTTNCWANASGTIGGSGRPAHSFGGVVLPPCSPDAASSFWTDVAHFQKLQFKSLSITNVVCVSTNSIQFSGTGSLKGIAGNKARNNDVVFDAFLQTSAGENNDAYYLRVYDRSGRTLLLISSNASNPLALAPVNLRSGSVEISPFICP